MSVCPENFSSGLDRWRVYEMKPSQLINFILKICCFLNNSAVFCDFKNIVFLEMLDKKTDLNFVKYQKKKDFFGL